MDKCIYAVIGTLVEISTKRGIKPNTVKDCRGLVNYQINDINEATQIDEEMRLFMICNQKDKESTITFYDITEPNLKKESEYAYEYDYWLMLNDQLENYQKNHN